jgi:tetratricopeptide (TPR) repeat protein
LHRAVYYGALRTFREAYLSLEEALRQTEDTYLRKEASCIRSLLLYQENELDSSVDSIAKAILEYPELQSNPDGRYLYEELQIRHAFALIRLNRVKEAIPLLTEALTFRSTPIDKAGVLANLGYCYSQLGNYEISLQYFDDACRAGLSARWERLIHYYMGVANAHIGRFREAKAEFKICERNLDKFQLPPNKVYGWLARMSRELDQEEEYEHYMMLAHPM